MILYSTRYSDEDNIIMPKVNQEIKTRGSLILMNELHLKVF